MNRLLVYIHKVWITECNNDKMLPSPNKTVIELQGYYCMLECLVLFLKKKIRKGDKGQQ